MIEYKTGNIFESQAQCLVNPVNCMGVMGKGLALEFKKQFPGMFPFYKQRCESGDLRCGTVGFWYDDERRDIVVCLFPTKILWHNPSTVSIIDSSLKAFYRFAPEMKIHHVAFPKVGCGLGGLDFDYQVRPLFERHFNDSNMIVEVYI